MSALPSLSGGEETEAPPQDFELPLKLKLVVESPISVEGQAVVESDQGPRSASFAQPQSQTHA